MHPFLDYLLCFAKT
nr:unnamed protein product [Callosobruchus analis]